MSIASLENVENGEQYNSTDRLRISARASSSRLCPNRGRRPAEGFPPSNLQLPAIRKPN